MCKWVQGKAGWVCGILCDVMWFDDDVESRMTSLLLAESTLWPHCLENM